MALILDRTLLDRITGNRDSILSRETGIMELLIAESVRLKASVVTEDEKERGRRMILNFGHTFGHAIETASGLKHGFAIAAGMLIASRISVQQGLLSADDHTKITDILRDFNLLRPFQVKSSLLTELISRDKKKLGEEINFVLLEAPGKAVVRKIRLSDLAEYHDFMNEWQ
jgi:3-dehydroquinate synthase